ncbi:MAG: methyl-accepting chemotaxis protein [Elusimicrobiales bacterium]|jgi:methyl-accepting chemotaxis protein
MIKRTILWVQPGFQKRMILFWTLQALVVTFLTYAITIGWTVYSTNPTLAGYIRVFVRPALLVSAAVGFLISCLAGLIYSHRIAGPVYRFKNVIDSVLAGNAPEIIVLRRYDELKDLGESLNKLLQHFAPARKNNP